MLQSASLLGGYGLTFFAVLIFASPAALVAMAGRPGTGRAAWSLPVMAAMLLAGAFVWGQARLGEASGAVVDGVKLRLVQANIPQAEKWKPENRAWIFKRYLDLSGGDEAGGGWIPSAGITHVIWPESSLSVLFEVDGAIYDAATRDAIKKIIPEGGTFILGGLRAETRMREDGKRYAERVFNSLFVLNSKTEITAAYDKIHLVPFGEYLPLARFISAMGFKHLVQQADAFHAGQVRQNIATPHAPDFLPLICYEAVFPGEVLADGAARPGWLLNLTDDSWFGATSGPYQHLQQARMRAVEEGLPVVRVANTGISAVIDAHGVVRASTSLEVPARLDVALPVALSTTFYGGHRGSVLLFVVVFALAGYVIFLKLN
jgi:apolipoprotein N-acyltransferase